MDEEVEVQVELCPGLTKSPGWVDALTTSPCGLSLRSSLASEPREASQLESIILYCYDHQLASRRTASCLHLHTHHHHLSVRSEIKPSEAGWAPLQCIPALPQLTNMKKHFCSSYYFYFAL